MRVWQHAVAERREHSRTQKEAAPWNTRGPLVQCSLPAGTQALPIDLRHFMQIFILVGLPLTTFLIVRRLGRNILRLTL